ncbi:ornithine cyclodeaminase family protein [Vibrio cholerae]|nr:ornithine cyclodeaminase family protein [Vibrio cholerae]
MYVLSESEVANVVGAISINNFMDALIEEIERGFVEYDQRGVELSRREGYTSNGNLIEWMPVNDGDQNVTIKVVSYFPTNPTSSQTPTIDAVIIAFDFHSGKPKAVIGGALLTAMRTGAASAVASKRLANQESRVLGLVGCGAQAITQAHALSRVFPINEVLVYDINKVALESIQQRLSFLDVVVRIVDIDEIERKSDIICTATTNPVGCGPVIQGQSLKPNVHINAVGADFPGKTELPKELVKSSFVVTDFFEQAKIEGECQVFDSDLASLEQCVELKEFLSERKDFGAVRDNISIFDSTGVALEDAIAVKVLCDLMKKEGLAKEMDEYPHSLSALDPYADVMKR